jgi:hypothetical protein
MDSKAALAQQRATLRRGARGKTHIGDDAGSASARAAEREKVHRMQAAQRAQQAEEERRTFLEDLRRERQRAEREAEQARREAHQEPLSALLGELISDSLRLARTFVRLPFRVAAALRHHRPLEA